MKTKTRLLLVGLAVLLAACAASGARIEKAKTVYYQTDYATVWNAVTSAVQKEGYDRLKVEDAAGGRIVSDWHKIERVADSQSAGPQMGGPNADGAIFFRVLVQVQGKAPPYKVFVDGEAAKYRPGFSSLFPYKHGADDEPDWVNGRINALYVAVLAQLEQYAVEPSAAQAQPGPAPVPPVEEPAATPPPAEGTTAPEAPDAAPAGPTPPAEPPAPTPPPH